MNRCILGGLYLLAVHAGAAAQLPQYVVTPAAKPGGSLPFALIGQPGLAFASYADIDGGPRLLLGEELFLGLTPALTLVDAGVLGIGGLHTGAFQVPAGAPPGVVIHLQSVVLDGRAPNGVFRASNGESTVLYKSTAVLVEELTDPELDGFTGTWDRSRKFRIHGAAPRSRVQTIRPSQGVPFDQPLAGPLNPYGARVQMVYRAAELGANGEPEVLVALRWLPRGAVTAATYPRLAIDVVHTLVVPDYTVDLWSALPKYPASGLGTTFANNPKPADVPVRVVDQAYAFGPQHVRADGYVGYPALQQTFVYNGFDSLLLDFRTMAMAAPSANGQQVQLMVLSSPQPNARVAASGTSSAPVNPFVLTQGQGDNALCYMQFEFARVDSFAESPWRQAPVLRPDYHTPSIAKSEPVGTFVGVEYRGASDAKGTNATFWSSDVNFADSQPFLQFRITMYANAATGAVPSVEGIVVPIN